MFSLKDLLGFDPTKPPANGIWTFLPTFNRRFVITTLLGTLAFGFWILVDLYTTDTRGLPGPASAFDPTTELEEVQTFAGKEAQLRRIQAIGVRSDGTVDLKGNDQAMILYEFLNPNKITTIRVSHPWKLRGRNSINFLGMNTETQFLNMGMERIDDLVTGDPNSAVVPNPKCSFASLWRIALEHGAPKEAVANMTYDEDGYLFYISNTTIRHEFNMDCELKPTL